MTPVHGIERVRDILGEFSFSDFRVVRELRFYEDQAKDGTPSVDLVVETDERSPNVRVVLQCSSVSALRINGFGGQQTRITGFDVQDISDRAWEGIAFEILDFENNSIHLYSRSVSITDAQEVI